MSEQLRASAYVQSPRGDEVQACDEIPAVVTGDPGGIIITIGAFTISFTSAADLIALASGPAV